MLGSLGRVGGRGGSGSAPFFGARLIQPGALAGGGIITFSRAQAAGARSTAFAANDVTFDEYAANVPRFNGSSRKLLLEGQRTNGIRNPRFEGGSTGTPGVYPTNMNVDTDAGLTRTIVGFGVEFGMSYMDVQWAGTASTGFVGFRPDLTTVTSAAVGQVWTGSLFARMVAGTTANVGGFRFVAFARNSGGTTLNTYPGILTPLTASIARHSLVTSALPDATTAFISGRIDVAVISGAVIDITVRFYAPQLETGSFASTPIFPSIGVPAASTRGTDNFTATGTQFASLFPNGVGTVLGRAILPVLSPVGSANQAVLSIGFDTANRILVFNGTGNTTLTIGRSISNTFLSAGTGAITAGSSFAFGLTSDGTTLSASINGGALLTVSGVPTFNRLVVGADANLLGSMFGEYVYLDTLPNVISPVDLPAAVSAIPS